MATTSTLSIALQAQDTSIGQEPLVNRAFQQVTTGALAGTQTFVIGTAAVQPYLAVGDSLNYSRSTLLRNTSTSRTVYYSFTLDPFLDGGSPATVLALLPPGAVFVFPTWSYISGLTVGQLAAQVTDPISGQIYLPTDATNTAVVELVQF